MEIRREGRIMIEVKNLSKHYKDRIAVNNLSFKIIPGVVTGFLGPNGAGKSTTMKMILNLTRPSQGEVIIDGKKYIDLERPIAKIGALIDADAVNPRLTADQHLQLIAIASGISFDRVDEVLQKSGLEKVRNKTVGQYSLGMKQRLGIAAALLGDPKTVILDEPFNGLDVDGIKWLRSLTKKLAREGKAVLISSHLIGEIQAIAERVIVLAQGTLIADMTIEEMSKKSFSSYIRIQSEDNHRLQELLKQKEGLVQRNEKESIVVRNLQMEDIGITAKENNIALFELTRIQPSLEQLFMEMTDGKVDYVSEEKHEYKER